jgi:hypothetical protein
MDLFIQPHPFLFVEASSIKAFVYSFPLSPSAFQLVTVLTCISPYGVTCLLESVLVQFLTEYHRLENYLGLGCISVVECLLSMCEVLGSITSTAKQEKELK